jgi:NAD(P)-dependent dehydrogenase (short-subunit alcohol dehydrogenase family)
MTEDDPRRDPPRPLAGRVALVTGASRGIGAAIARALAAAGAKTVLAARSEAALQALADELAGSGGAALAVRTDVSDPASVRRLVERTLHEYGRLDFAVNNAGDGGRRPTPLADLDVEDHDRSVAVSQRGVFASMKYEIPAMLEGGGGAIVNMASTAAVRPVGGLAGYVAAKCAVVGLTRVAALDYAARGIRVNALAPGPILTEQLQQAGGRAQQLAAASLPVGRLGTAEEVAAAATWLCSDEAAFITGAVLPMDGGLLAGMPAYQPHPSQAAGG